MSGLCANCAFGVRFEKKTPVERELGGFWGGYKLVWEPSGKFGIYCQRFPETVKKGLADTCGEFKWKPEDAGQEKSA